MGIKKEKRLGFIKFFLKFEVSSVIAQNTVGLVTNFKQKLGRHFKTNKTVDRFSLPPFNSLLWF